MENVVIIVALFFLACVSIVSITAIVGMYLNMGFKFKTRNEVKDIKTELTVDMKDDTNQLNEKKE